ncbi:MAG: transcriptional regulator [Flavobacteriaceae bacterium]|nr:transcriptional regulator [Flavobacteriaceae bacterium]
MVNSADFTKRLEKILDYYGLSATAFSEKIDFNRSTISHLISGRNKPSLEFVMKVVHTFEEVNLYWLLNGKGSFPASAEIENNPKNHTQKLSRDATHSATENTVEKKETFVVPDLEVQKNVNSNAIDRIVIFYSDGTFKEYVP